MPLSEDSVARARQLANLRPGGVGPPAPEKGNTRTLKHGGYSEALVADVSDEVQELMAALAEVVPVRDADGQVPASDVPGLEAAARALRRYRKVSSYLDLHGRLDEKTGAPVPAANFELDVERSYWRALEAFGLTPQAKAKLGSVLARTVDLATAIRDQQEEADDDA